MRIALYCLTLRRHVINQTPLRTPGSRQCRRLRRDLCPTHARAGCTQHTRALQTDCICFLQDRVTDHRINKTYFGLDDVMAGEALQEFIQELQTHYELQALAELG